MRLNPAGNVAEPGFEIKSVLRITTIVIGLH